MFCAAGANCEQKISFSPPFVHECSLIHAHMWMWRWGIQTRSLTQVLGSALVSTLSWESRHQSLTTLL